MNCAFGMAGLSAMVFTPRSPTCDCAANTNPHGTAGLPSCGGRGVADGQPDGPVAEIGHEVQPSAEGLDVAGDDLEGGDLAVLNLRHPGDTHPHDGGDLLLAQAKLLAEIGRAHV